MYDYEDIRSYQDQDVRNVLDRLLQEPAFYRAVQHVHPEWTEQAIKKLFAEINTIGEFQDRVIYGTVDKIIKNTTNGLHHQGLESLDQDAAYLFITNHRDIILDSALLNYILFEKGFNTTQIAIGDNLLIYPWITDLVRINKSFIVKRNLSRDQFFTESQRLSTYIRKSITEDNSSIWIAQKEGRTKNGLDKTHPGLLKMLGMSGEKDLIESFASLNILPISISYEKEPCDGLKAKELVNPEYKKSVKDDLMSMYSGIFSAKGRIKYSFGKPIDKNILASFSTTNKNDFLKLLAEHIDQQIFTNFQLWPANYIAYDVLNNTSRYDTHYQPEDKQKFLHEMKEILKSVDAQGDAYQEVYLNIYANPLKNKEAC